jgi:hypothetical protein
MLGNGSESRIIAKQIAFVDEKTSRDLQCCFWVNESNNLRHLRYTITILSRRVFVGVCKRRSSQSRKIAAFCERQGAALLKIFVIVTASWQQWTGVNILYWHEGCYTGTKDFTPVQRSLYWYKSFSTGRSAGNMQLQRCSPEYDLDQTMKTGLTWL